MNTNKIIVLSSVVIIILLIAVPTAYKVIKNHHHNLYKVVNDKIIDNAKRCYDDEICQDDRVTLEFLYKNDYLDEMADPVTKEVYSLNSYVLKNEDNYEFVVVE